MIIFKKNYTKLKKERKKKSCRTKETEKRRKCYLYIYLHLFIIFQFHRDAKTISHKYHVYKTNNQNISLIQKLKEKWHEHHKSCDQLDIN